MARFLEIPSEGGTKKITNEVESGVLLIVDGIAGEVIVNPTEEDIAFYIGKKEEFEAQKAEWQNLFMNQRYLKMDTMLN